MRDLSAAFICFASVIGFNNPLILSLKACHKSGYLIGLSHHCKLNRHIQLKVVREGGTMLTCHNQQSTVRGMESMLERSHKPGKLCCCFTQ